MNRSMIRIIKDNQPGLVCPADVEPLEFLWEAQSNSPDNKMRLSGDPEVLEVTKIFLQALPPTYTKKDALKLMVRAVEEVYES